MSKRKITDLKPCPFCGGQPELIIRKVKGHVTTGTRREKTRIQEKFIRCEKCHASTVARSDINDLRIEWTFRRLNHD